jgi:hypothetical protein
VEVFNNTDGHSQIKGSVRMHTYVYIYEYVCLHKFLFQTTLFNEELVPLIENVFSECEIHISQHGNNVHIHKHICISVYTYFPASDNTTLKRSSDPDGECYSVTVKSKFHNTNLHKTKRGSTMYMNIHIYIYTQKYIYTNVYIYNTSAQGRVEPSRAEPIRAELS